MVDADSKPNTISASASTTADRFRERARSTATLLVTAAGALAAGFAFSPMSRELSPVAQVSGYAALYLFAISGCFYTAASLHFVPSATGDKEKVVVQVTSVIAKRTRIGSWVAIAALFSTLMMPVFHYGFPAPQQSVTVTLADETLSPTSCPSLTSTFPATTTELEMSGQTPLIKVNVSAETCGNHSAAGPLTLYFDRRNISLTVAPQAQQ